MHGRRRTKILSLLHQHPTMTWPTERRNEIKHFRENEIREEYLKHKKLAAEQQQQISLFISLYLNTSWKQQPAAIAFHHRNSQNQIVESSWCLFLDDSSSNRRSWVCEMVLVYDRSYAYACYAYANDVRRRWHEWIIKRLSDFGQGWAPS